MAFMSDTKIKRLVQKLMVWDHTPMFTTKGQVSIYKHNNSSMYFLQREVA
jgi:hypothetical protein